MTFLPSPLNSPQYLFAKIISTLVTKLQALEEEVRDKQNIVASVSGGETVLHGDDFKRYVGALKAKSNVYKNRRAELNDLRAEYGVLQVTSWSNVMPLT